MPFWKKDKGAPSQKFRPGNPHTQELSKIKREEWQQPDPDQGLPGTSGYFDGVKSGPHPQRFKYVRPDEHEDKPDPAPDPDGALLPSQRPVPRGFFGR